METDQQPVRHVLGISGGKDSAALAVYLKDKGRVPEMEYFFCDTGHELPEVYDFLDRLEAYLDKPIARLSADSHEGKTPFEHHLARYNNFLPSPKERWCTRELKIRPFERFVGNSTTFSYIAIRADEFREGYLSSKPNIKPLYPFIQDGITREDVFQILRDTVGIPSYYEWRSRSGCFFCFFQRRQEWIELYRRYPDLYRKAMAFEKVGGPEPRYSWVQGMTLEELAARAVTEDVGGAVGRKDPVSWQTLVSKREDDSEDGEQPCLICTL